MSTTESTLGLNCPNCGGVIPVPEGQAIVCCPFCNMSSFVRGQRGLRRFQVNPSVKRETAAHALQHFLSENWAIARDAARTAQLSDVFLAHIPFWVAWGRVMGWTFGEKKVGSGDHQRYEPREVKTVEDMVWDGAACDVGEFGVGKVPLSIQSLAQYNPDNLHASGLVFEPVSSFSDAQNSAQADFSAKLKERSGLDRIAQIFFRVVRQRYGLVYYPLWVLRYIYRGRSFQLIVDGNSGKVLYGKGPGNTLYRAAVLVLGMAAGSFLLVDVPALILSATNDHGNSNICGVAVAAAAAGIVLMVAAYRKFRYGEQFEYFDKDVKPSSASQLTSPEGLYNEAEKWLSKLR